MALPRYHTCALPPTCRIYVHPIRNSFGLIELGRLSRDTRLTSDSCSSGWGFAIGFLHRSRCLPRLAELLVLPLFGRTANFHRIDTRALLGAHESGRSPWIISTGVLPHHVAYGSRTTRLRAVIGVSSVLSVLLFAYPVPFTYLSRPLCSAEFSFRGAPVWSIQVAQKGVRAAGGN